MRFLFLFFSISALAVEPHSSQSMRLEIPEIKNAEVCLASTKDASDDQMDWFITCLDAKRKFLFKSKKIGTERSTTEDDASFGDLEITVEMKSRGFHLVSAQDGLFFVR